MWAIPGPYAAAPVDLDGTPRGWPHILDALMLVWREEQRGGRISCHAWPCCYRRGGPCTLVPDDEICGHRFGVCPWELMRGAPWRAIWSHHALAEIAPLAGWPYAQAAWVASGLLALRQAIAEVRSRNVDGN